MTKSVIAIIIVLFAVITTLFFVEDFPNIGRPITSLETKDSTISKTVYIESIKIENNEISYTHKNYLGSPIAETDEQGRIINKPKYKPYGESDNSEGKDYTGKVKTGMGTVNLGAREYDSSIRRFSTPDPILQGATSPYVYGGNNPLKFIDPDGLEKKIPNYLKEGSLECGSSCAANPEQAVAALEAGKKAARAIGAYAAGELSIGIYDLTVAISGNDVVAGDYGLGVGERLLSAVGIIPGIPQLRFIGKGADFLNPLRNTDQLELFPDPSLLYRGDISEQGLLLSKHDQLYGEGSGEKVFYSLSPSAQQEAMFQHSRNSNRIEVDGYEGPSFFISFSDNPNSAKYYAEQGRAMSDDNMGRVLVSDARYNTFIHNPHNTQDWSEYLAFTGVNGKAYDSSSKEYFYEWWAELYE